VTAVTSCHGGVNMRSRPFRFALRTCRPMSLCTRSDLSRCSKLSKVTRLLRQRGQGAWRDGEAKRAGGVEVDHQLELCWSLDREIGRLLAVQDTVNIACRTAVLINKISRIGNKATVSNERAFEIDGRQFVSGCHAHDHLAIERRPAACCHDQSAGSRKRLPHFLGVACVDQGHVHTE